MEICIIKARPTVSGCLRSITPLWRQQAEGAVVGAGIPCLGGGGAGPPALAPSARLTLFPTKAGLGGGTVRKGPFKCYILKMLFSIEFSNYNKVSIGSVIIGPAKTRYYHRKLDLECVPAAR